MSTSMELADRPDLAPKRDKGQWQRQQPGRAEVRGRVGGLRSENLRCGFRDFSGLLFHKINVIGKSKSVISFFFSPLACRSRVGEAKKKKKKKETLAGHRNPASRTRSGVRHVSDTDTTPKMACPCNLVVLPLI